jgi:hypothetical protein
MTTSNNPNAHPLVIAAKKSSMVLFLNEVSQGSSVRIKAAAARRATTFLAGVYSTIDGENLVGGARALLKTGAVSVVMTEDLTIKRFAVGDKTELKALYSSFEQAAKWLHTAKCVERLMAAGGQICGEYLSGQLMSMHQSRIRLAIKGGMSPRRAEEVVGKSMRTEPHMGIDLTFCTDNPSMNSVLGFIAPELVAQAEQMEFNASIIRTLVSEPSIVSSVLDKMASEHATVAPEVIPTDTVIEEVSEEAVHVEVAHKALSA